MHCTWHTWFGPAIQRNVMLTAGKSRSISPSLSRFLSALEEGTAARIPAGLTYLCASFLHGTYLQLHGAYGQSCGS